MGLFDKLMALRNALNYGEQLGNSATWKVRAIRINAIAGLVAVLLPFVGMENVDHETINDFAAGVGAVYALFNAWAHVSTSAKVGF